LYIGRYRPLAQYYTARKNRNTKTLVTCVIYVGIRCSYYNYLSRKAECFISHFRFDFSAKDTRYILRLLLCYNIIVVIVAVVTVMSSYRTWLRVVLAFALLSVVYGAPIWEELFGFPPRQHYHRNTQPTARTPRAGGKEKYKATCWVINADNYAFPGQSPYPSAPLCPY